MSIYSFFFFLTFLLLCGLIFIPPPKWSNCESDSTRRDRKPRWKWNVERVLAFLSNGSKLHTSLHLVPGGATRQNVNELISLTQGRDVDMSLFKGTAGLWRTYSSVWLFFLGHSISPIWKTVRSDHSPQILKPSASLSWISSLNYLLTLSLEASGGAVVPAFGVPATVASVWGVYWSCSLINSHK